ncbi:MAG: ORF6N domain-containing protein, partial [Ruminococcus sp.]|nr:ORF6N domain-containing protein [Ruminococcus sp.]
LTTAQLAEAYGTDVRIISNNFNRNRDRFVEGVHFYRLKNAELQAFKKTSHQFDDSFKRAKTLYLWTERGALLHAKSLNTDKAWEVYEYLVDTYFKVREISKLYNEDIYHKLEVLEQKLEMSEKRNVMIYQKLEMSEKRNNIIYQELEVLKQKMDDIENNSVIRTDNIINSIEKSITDNLYNVINTLTPAFECIYNKINKSTYILSSKNYKRKRKNK